MIQSNELRLHNWVEYDGKYYQIDTIANEFPTLNTSEFGIGVVDWNNINPIPLTEELLLKCGFVKDGIPTGYTILNKFQLRYCCKDIIKNIWEWNFEAYNDDNWIGISKPQYLHQLQNLYFALINKELEINL